MSNPIQDLINKFANGITDAQSTSVDSNDIQERIAN